jgi:hypothetical protein
MVAMSELLQLIPALFPIHSSREVRSLIARVSADNTRRSASWRPRVRRDPLCGSGGASAIEHSTEFVASGMPGRGGMWAARHAADVGSAAAERYNGRKKRDVP